MPIFSATDEITSLEDLFGFNYDASTRTNNSTAEKDVSRRKKYNTFNCDVKSRHEQMKKKLQDKLKKQRRRAELEKIVAKHNARKNIK